MNGSNKTLAHFAVIRALEREPQNFRQLLEGCHSLFPDQLSSLLNGMVENHFIGKRDEEYELDASVHNRWRRLHADWQESLDRAYELLSAIMGRIHLPHCLDYEWWFSHSGREKMAEILLHRNPLPVLFPILTRPTSLQERKQVLESATSYGLSLIAMESHVAHYLTPHFEQETLKQKGIDAKNWRRGDLAVFVSEGAMLPENIIQRLEEDEWIEILIGKVKIKLRVKDENPDVYIAPQILGVRDKNSGFPSVSRRDPLRNEIDLWTSTQRGLKIKGYKAMWKIVEGFKNNLTFAEIFESIKQSLPAGAVPDSALQDVENVLLQLRQHISKE